MFSGKVAILTSENSSFVPYAKQMIDVLTRKGYHAELFYRHEDIGSRYQVAFILSYFRIIGNEHLKQREHNLVVHASDLPRGRGWSPLFWQILEGKDEIPFVLFEANENVDDGDIYLKKSLHLEGHELHDDIREKQALVTIDLCIDFIEHYEDIKPMKQEGEPSYYRKRGPMDSELDINKTIAEQFNSLRIASNEDYPAFFHHLGHRYILRIDKTDGE